VSLPALPQHATGWLIPSEITPLAVRSCGQSLSTLVNFSVAFTATQTFLSLLCALTWKVYLFFATWVFLMVCYAVVALPETRGVPIEQMATLWQQHWLWGRLAPAGEHGQEEKQQQQAQRMEDGAAGLRMSVGAGNHSQTSLCLSLCRPQVGVDARVHSRAVDAS
jgi:hypothetical protein